MTDPVTTYVELYATSHFSFLRGASSPEELFAAAAALGHSALGLCDRGSVAGMVRGLSGQEGTGVRLIAGTRVDLRDGRSILLYPTDRAAWSRLTRLLSLGKARGGKGNCWLDWPDVASSAEGLVAILLPGEADERARLDLAELQGAFGARAHLALALRRRPGDFARLRALDALAQELGVRAVALGDILYHAPERRPLQDVLTAIREKTTVDALGFKRERFMDRALKSPAEMERRFALFPDAIAATADIAAACGFDLGEIRYQYPYEQVMEGRTAQEALAALTEEGANRMFPGGVPPAYRKQIEHELRLIGELGYAPYFLTVNSIVAESRRRGILCQGRGSAANSCVCFLLGVTSIDPIKHELLFERFVSGERKEPPDIDVDFEHERREEIIQWIYETYGRHRSALTAVVTRYRTRGAVAEVGKALGLPRDLTKMLTGLIWGWSMDGIPEERIAELNLNANDYRLRLTLDLARQLIGTPRHLSQHPGGFVLTEERLDDLVPIEPARMEDRQIIEWDKDDIDVLKFMKVDVLGLGMLGCMNRAFNLLREHKAVDVGMADLQDDDPAVYGMIQKADTLGVFQIESRAQMSMLPRIKPKCFYDLVIEVAIVRPGPIQGDMVHPYLRRREGKEKPEYPKPELRAVLEKTLGVPLFQEQAMKVAIVGAGFTPVEADQLRRAMATFKLTGGVSHFYDKLVGGMVERGYPKDFAERTFKQIEGFGSYGFPESHAASFAKIAYASCWMKHHHPDVFCAALLNAQPMGFYAPAQIVRDAQKHGVEVRPVSINDSHWDCTLERSDGRYLAVRLGFRQVRSLANIHGAAIVGARGDLPYDCVEDVWRRAGVPRAAIERIAEADGFACLSEDRRQGLWKVRGLGEAPLPLFAAADAREANFSPEGLEPRVALRPMTEGREVVEDYRTLQLSLRAHPLSFLREELDRMGIVRCADLGSIRDGRNIEVAGVILVRQRPGSAKGVLFITIEDETGIANGILWPDRFDIYRRQVMAASMIAMRGRVQKEGEIIHVICDRITDHDVMLRQVGRSSLSIAPGRGDGARNGGGPDSREPALRVRSHDFH
ncbi:error-prone DNA polymerase [Sphingopyxis sp.]|jgi:error-prone DNA polymerase|uniref:error-prone DNA polymerase n=1 Tax=Sphingopyxis sp. TaxID=1908224 RepID=UPI002C1CFE00|nr:error-prone DNA polymerase [Sphingopyxis sp.]HET6525400.1 error-prone DNA polymerase [Sphingopyxis sp.]HMO75590.1 error-prone DNA polymerase [Sphingopyxis sp.]HMP45052.1 error-prone DNA polymerase [Sphingopyxis sp.]HMQ17753.1 error-prone DNA polymerase [Sphingopyxis sp.]